MGSDTPQHSNHGRTECAWPDLGAGTVHVWNVPLEAHDNDVAGMLAVLDPGERDRAARFHQPRHHRRFVVRRWAARAILSRYLSITPRRVATDATEFGKPTLSAPTLSEARRCGADARLLKLRFSLSHSHEWALLSVAADGEVGVDLERRVGRSTDRRVARQFFAPGEMRSLETLDANQYAAGFFNAWTRKEAFVKAIGKGLTVPLDAFEVSVLPGDPVELKWVSDDLSGGRRWWLYDLGLLGEYTGALAASFDVAEVHHYRFGCENLSGGWIEHRAGDRIGTPGNTTGAVTSPP